MTHTDLTLIAQGTFRTFSKLLPRTHAARAPAAIASAVGTSPILGPHPPHPSKEIDTPAADPKDFLRDSGPGKVLASLYESLLPPVEMD